VKISICVVKSNKYKLENLLTKPLARAPHLLRELETVGAAGAARRRRRPGEVGAVGVGAVGVGAVGAARQRQRLREVGVVGVGAVGVARRRRRPREVGAVGAIGAAFLRPKTNVGAMQQ